ncbi:MAG: transposase [Synergistaceae bacterium]|nr:transposase [Synergistaceae bacterium]
MEHYGQQRVPSFYQRKGIEENFPEASITFDRFHVIKAANEVLEKVRRSANNASVERSALV